MRSVCVAISMHQSKHDLVLCVVAVLSSPMQVYLPVRSGWSVARSWQQSTQQLVSSAVP